MENNNRFASESIGIVIYNANEEKKQIYNLIVKGQELFDSSVIWELPLQLDDNCPVVTLIKNQSTQRICDIDDSSIMRARVDFDLHISIMGYLKYNIGNKGNLSLGYMSQITADTLEIVDGDGYTIAKKEVDWRPHFES